MSVAPPDAPPATASQSKLTRNEWGLLLLLAAVNCTEITDALLLTPLADTLQKTDGGLGLSKQQYSFCAAVYGFSAAVCGLLAAMFVDRCCRKQVVVVALFGLLVAIAASGFAYDFISFFIARAIAGAFGGVTVCGTLAILADRIPESRRGVALSILNGSFGVAAVIGLPVCVGLLVITGWFGAPFLLVAGVGLVVWAMAAWKLPRMVDHCREGRGNPLADMVRVVGRWNHLRAFAFMLCSGLGAYTVIPFMAQYMQLNCGVPANLFPMVFLAMGLCSLAAGVVAGVAADKLGRRPVFLVAIGLFAITTLVITNLPAVPVLVAGLVACAYMATAVGRLVPVNAIMLAAAHPPDRGAYTTVFNSVSLLATSFGPLVAGLLVPNTGEDTPVENFAACGLVAVGFTVAAVTLSFTVRPATQHPAAAA
ncbi:MAG: MFS transporter [Fimbriiglobus sp.]|nr:MFS transporter [Fimbriiglobus sp.]